MKKPSIRTIIGILLIVFLIILATLFLKMAKESSKCADNPFVYGAQKTAEQGLEVVCSCIPLDPKYAGFYFDKVSLNIQKYLGFSP